MNTAMLAKYTVPLLLFFVSFGYGFPSFRYKHRKSYYGIDLTQKSQNILPILQSLPNDNVGDDWRTKNGFDQDFEYSRCLTPKEERDSVLNEDEYSLFDKRTKRRWQRLQIIKSIRKLMRNINLGRSSPKPGNLILVRGGESDWNTNKTFTGWADPDLSSKGKLECEHTGRLLLEQGYEPDIVYTSRLKRSIHSAWIILNVIDAMFIPIFKSWRLNERNYGSLTGLSKQETAKKLGIDVVQAWRNSLKARPPPLKQSDPYYPGRDRRYADLSDDQIPLTESILDCMDRTRPLWEYKILNDLKKGTNVMVVAHGSTLKGIIKQIDGVSNTDIEKVFLPTAIPFVYKFDEQMNPIKPREGSRTLSNISGVFLEKPGLVETALKEEEEIKGKGLGLTTNDHIQMSYETNRISTVQQSLLKLKEEQLIAGQNSADGYTTSSAADRSIFEQPSMKDDSIEVQDETFVNIDMIPPELIVPGIGSYQKPNEPVVVFIRHGRTPHNNLGLFTGWEDAPLAPDGVEDAKNAGKLLKKHGFEFDVVYTSWLNRAISTAWYVLDELDQCWLPIVKSWRLNERMYGALTGKSKKMVANIYGEDQLKKWRRGYTIRPPPVSSYSLSYPGNDYRRIKYVKDIRVSWTETFCRSVEERKFRKHRKFPKSESLKDCMDRSIPFYTQRIVPEAVNKGKRVLIASHENAIRGILMHLCDIPEEAMNGLHLPNGLPLVYNVRRKCITILDDGSGKDPMEIHDFGPAAKYLFRPCELDDHFFKVEIDEAKEKVVDKEKVPV